MLLLRPSGTHTLAPIALLLATAAQGQVSTTITRVPVADAFVSAAPTRAGQNFGGAGAICFAPVGAARGECQSLLRFDLAGVPAALDAQFGPGAWTIASATLELVAVPPLNPIFNATTPGNIGVDWTAGDAWIEGTGTPNLPATNGLTFNSLASHLSAADRPLGTFPFSGASGAIAFVLGLDPDFVSDLEAGGLVGLRLFSQGGAAVVNSRDFTSNPASHPMLVLKVNGPCRADLTTGAIPGQPGYGVPDGTLNNDDFFYYLGQFAAGNVAVADLTTGAISGQAGYGIPNGVLNNDDFFFFLTIFAAGC